MEKRDNNVVMPPNPAEERFEVGAMEEKGEVDESGSNKVEQSTHTTAATGEANDGVAYDEETGQQLIQEVVSLNQQEMVELEEKACSGGLEEKACSGVEHEPDKWNNFVILDDNTYFKNKACFDGVPCAICGRLAHVDMRKKSNATHFQLDNIWNIRHCNHMGRNDCKFYVCGHCFVKEKITPLNNTE